jgi:succinylglutamic semialdehyde dehydrogenase
MIEAARGNYIGSAWRGPSGGATVRSMNPAREGEAVFEAAASVDAVNGAVEAAGAAWPEWRRLGFDRRAEALDKVAAALPAHVDGIAAEAKSIAGKIAGCIAQIPHELGPAGPGAPGEQRFRSLGPVAIIGPFNFPAHLVNTHLVPALLTGNTVIAKPSEVTPLVGQRYAALFAEAGLPAGVFNMVQGGGDVGAALVEHPEVAGVVFTGSYHTGRRIMEATLDQPFKKIALELGGKNPAVVLDDADLDQTVREILLGALLTSGQRCTATSRVVATRGIAEALRDRLAGALARIEPGDPLDPATFLGPLANARARDRFVALLESARAEGCRPVVESETRPGGCFVTPGLYDVRGDEAILREELFGPHISFEVAEDEADAFRRGTRREYGLSASLFSADPDAFERFYDVVPAGVLNFNRSTNGASGLLPFGGVGMSGNWRPAGSMAARNTTYPVAVMQRPYGELTPHPYLDALAAPGQPASQE